MPKDIVIKPSALKYLIAILLNGALGMIWYCRCPDM